MTTATATRTQPIRLGVVSFLNTLPLIDGLDVLRDVSLHHSVPSLLLDKLLEDSVDVALCSSVDYQRSPVPLVMLPVGLLGCDGPTLTVRLYSTLPIKDMKRVYCDRDSHTSIALLRILLREVYDLDPTLVEYDAREHVAENKPIDWPEAVLLIGDKVVTDSPPAVRYPHQLDLGELWNQHTQRPFVFAQWMARAEADPAVLSFACAILDRQFRYNRSRAGSIVHSTALPRRWPKDLAQEYLNHRITYELTDERIAGLEMFFRKLREHKLIDELRPLNIFQP